MVFTTEQVEQLLQPINPSRVLKDGKGHSHVSQQDILAHLIRVFGFGNFDTAVMYAEPVFETERSPGRWDVCYRAMVRLTVRDPDGAEVCHFENGSTATAQNQTRGDAHDLAYKSSISLSYKRAAIALGDQFGLSLYNKGQMSALVRGTKVGMGRTVAGDMQEGVPQQVSLGNDEIEADMDALLSEPPAAPQVERNMQRPPRPAPAAKPDVKMTASTRAGMFGLFSELNLDETQQKAGIGVVLGLDGPIASRGDLTEAQAQVVITALKKRRTAQTPAPDEPTLDDPTADPGWGSDRG